MPIANSKACLLNAEMTANAPRCAVARAGLTLADVDFIAAATSQGGFPLPRCEHGARRRGKVRNLFFLEWGFRCPATKACESDQGGGRSNNQKIQELQRTISAVRGNTEYALDEIHAASSDGRHLSGNSRRLKTKSA
jgi:hypothetical protein